jgi:hypothetical protein
MDANALSGFQTAANYWQSKLTDDITVNINVGFSALNPGVLGSAGSSKEVFNLADVRGALIGDATTATDALAIGNLPALSALGGMSFLTQVNSETGSTAVSLDNDNSDNNRFLALNKFRHRKSGGENRTPAD